MLIDGKYYFNLRIQEYTDFIEPLNLICFTMKENCGAAGTIFEVSFLTNNQKIADLIIENNEVTFEIGETAENAKSYKAYISEHPEKPNTADNGYIGLSFVATSVNLKFYTERLNETVFGTSLSMVKAMAKNYLGTEVDVKIDEPSEVEHYWLRSYDTGAVTMMEAWLHMNLPKTVPLLWIDSENIVHISDLEKIKKDKAKARFYPADIPPENVNANDYKYLNNFVTKSYKFDTNLVTGEDTIVNISSIESGDDTVVIPETKPDVASTTQVEKGTVGKKIMDGKYQTDNVHSRFMASYYANKLRLIQLSSHVGELQTLGFIKDINPCDLIEVIGCDAPYLGRYIVNTKIVGFGSGIPITTIFYVCRDNTNSIENSDITPKSQVILHNQQMTDILQSIRTLRRVTVMGTRMLDGTTKGQILAYCKSFKYNALRNFSVMGAELNLNSSLEIMQSLKAIGNSIINNLIDKFIPYPYNLLLHNLVFEGLSFKRLLSKLFYQYAPQWMRDFLIEIIGLLDDLANLADALHKQNSKSLSNYNYVSGGYGTPSASGKNETNNASGTPSENDNYIPTIDNIGGDMPVDNTQKDTERIESITDEIIDNVDGIDLPIPPISLDESDSLLPDSELKEVIAEKVVNYLVGQGYLEGIGTQDFLAILMGKKPLDFNTIKLINANIGNVLYARYWGTYTGELTKLGRIEDIANNIIEVPGIDITEEVFNGDLVVINGTDVSNGTYTAVEVKYDDVAKMSTVKVLEDITPYVNTPARQYTYLCDVQKVESHLNIEGYEDVTAIYLQGNYSRFLPSQLPIYITNLGMDGYCAVLKSEYNVDTDITTVYTTRYLNDVLNQQKKLQIIVETENGTSISKLSNDTLTEFYIKNAFKDIYSTVPCTKIINAQAGTKVWIAIPDIEENIEFYINSTKVDMDVITGIDLNLYAIGGAKLYYNVYMSKDTYNSNNVTLEIRRKQ